MMKTRKVRIYFVLLLLFGLAAAALLSSGCGQAELRLGTTTNLGQSGLLARIIPGFEEQNDVKVTVVKRDTTSGVLKLAKSGDLDVMLVNYSPECQEFINSKQGANTFVMYRNLVTVGPATDPAKLEGVPCMGMCKRMADSGANFVCCGDSTDVGVKLTEYWQKCGAKWQFPTSGQSWMEVSNKGVEQTLMVADQKQCYTVLDRLTWLQNQKEVTLKKLVDRCGMLKDQYSAVVVNQAGNGDKDLNTQAAKDFAVYLASDRIQKVITDFKRYGEALYIANAT